MLSGFTPRPLKKLFTANQCWASFLDAGGLRDIEVEAVTKMLACVTRITGVKVYGCDNPGCPHVNRVCGEKLPAVYSALGMDKPEPVAKVCYAQMSKQLLRRDPFECVLCGGKMVYRRAVAGLNVQGLKTYAREISLMRYIPG